MASLVQTDGFGCCDSPAPRTGRRWRALTNVASGALQRLVEAIYESRRRHAHHAITQYFADRGMLMTDAAERELMDRMRDQNWMSRG